MIVRNCNVEIFKPIITENELLENINSLEFVKKCWVNILPKKATFNKYVGNASYVDFSHLITFLKKSVPSIKKGYQIRYKLKTYDVQYVEIDYKTNKFIQAYAIERVENG